MNRNPQTSVKTVVGGKEGAAPPDSAPHLRSGGNAPRCPACGAEVQPKPGFRISSLKCPKCGASMAKK